MSEQKLDEDKLMAGFALILDGLGLDVENDPHLIDTPRRAARAWFHELCAGLTKEEPKFRVFESTADEMVMLHKIPIRSICAHHLLPFYGYATIAYIPGKGQLLGLSKLSRIANHWARRPQVQEDLTVQIANHLAELVVNGRNGGVGVIIRAEHMCMLMRGVTHDGVMITSAVRGVFRTDAQARNEFLRLANKD